MVQSHFIVKPNLVLRLGWGFDNSLELFKWIVHAAAGQPRLASRNSHTTVLTSCTSKEKGKRKQKQIKIRIRIKMDSCELWVPDFEEGVGRIIKAKRDIEIGEIVLTDTALLAVPDGFPVCLGCLGKVDGSFLCPGCACPVCSDRCQELSTHAAECELLAKNEVIPAGIDCGAPHGLYAVLPVVRALLLKQNDPKKYQVVEELMDHWEERREEKGVVGTVNFMGAFCRTKLGMEWVTDEDVQHAFGVLKTNGVGQGSHKCFLYPNLSLISHSCAANLDMVDRPANTIQLVAKRRIQMGEELTWR